MKEDFEGNTESFVGVGSSPLEWHNKEAEMSVKKLISMYGVPSSVDPSPGGIVIWKKDRLMNQCFDRLEVRDEAIPHAYPMPHNEFLYVFVNYDVAPSKFLDVTSITGSVTYDPLKKQLRARSNCVQSAIATLALATQVGEGHLSLNYVQSNELFPQYFIASKDEEQFQRLHDLLCYNLKHQSGTPESDGYWPLSVQANMPMPANLYP